MRRELEFVTHSVGGIHVRAYVAGQRPANLGRVVMLAPPNHGSEIVDAIGEWTLTELILGPTGTALSTERTSWPSRLGRPDYPVGVIAGDSSINPIGSMIIPGADDGTVSVESAKLAGMTDFIEMNVTRTFIMQDDEVGQHVLHFLEFGRFGSGGETRD